MTEESKRKVLSIDLTPSKIWPALGYVHTFNFHTLQIERKKIDEYNRDTEPYLSPYFRKQKEKLNGQL